MSTLNFPSNPVIGERYTIGSTTWIWTGTAWIKYSDPNKTFENVTATTVTVTTSTNSTSTNSGALVVGGGAGIGGDLWVGGTLYVGGQSVLTTSSFNNQLNAGDDIKITDIGGGVLRFDNTSTLQTVTTRGNSTTNIVYFNAPIQSTSTNTGAVIIGTGGLGVNGDVFVEGRVTSESLKILDVVFDSTVLSINTTTTATIVDTYLVSEYRSAKYLIQIDEGAGDFARVQFWESVVTVDNSGLVDYDSYSIVGTPGTGFVDIYPVINSGIIKIYITTLDSSPLGSLNVKVLRTGIAR